MTSKNHTLLWIVHEGHMSGANMALIEYFEILKDLNFDLKVVSPSAGTFTHHLNTIEIPVTIVPFYPWTREKGGGYFIKGWLWRLIRNSYATMKLVALAKGAKAICTNTICTQLGLVTAWLSRKPHFLFVHEFGEEDHGFHLAVSTPKAYRFFYKYSQKVVLNSKAVQLKWEKFTGTKKFAVLYNPVNIKRDILQSAERVKPVIPKFLMLGQISEAKGHAFAIEAVEYISNHIKEIELHIIGSKVSPDYFETLERRIENSKASIYLKPPVANPFLLFNDYTAMLMCSRQEAFGRVTVEALKSGLPVIGLNSGGTPEIVEDIKNGYLVEPGLQDELIDRMEKMIAIDEQGYHQMVANAKIINEKFNEPVTRQQLQSIFKSLN